MQSRLKFVPSAVVEKIILHLLIGEATVVQKNKWLSLNMITLKNIVLWVYMKAADANNKPSVFLVQNPHSATFRHNFR